MKKKTIKIAEDVLDLVPDAFKNLPDVDYRLTKTESSRPGSVFQGDNVVGPANIVNVIGKPGVKVFQRGGGGFDLTYIRTSPIVEVLDTTDTTITFRTEGGVYKLERA
jgi:hypothetical protein